MNDINNGQTKNTQIEGKEHDVDAVAKRVVKVPSLGGKRVIGLATSGSPLYVAETSIVGALDSESVWTITRYIYTSGSGLVEGKVAIGSWDNRASLTYE